MVAEQSFQANRRRALLDERQKLLQAHYAGAIPLVLLKSEQDRITQELAAAESRLGDVEQRLAQTLQHLEEVLALVGDCPRAHLIAPSTIRRHFNQAFFTALYVSDDETVRGELAAPFALLLDKRLRDAVPVPEAAAELVPAGRSSDAGEVRGLFAAQFNINKPPTAYGSRV